MCCVMAVPCCDVMCCVLCCVDNGVSAGRTAMMSASAQGRLDVINALLQAGGDPGERDLTGTVTTAVELF